jgi:hypothetical protein
LIRRERIHVRDDGMVLLDGENGAPLFRVAGRRDGGPFIEFKDRNNYRSDIRGADLIMFTLADLEAAIEEWSHRD